MATVIHLPIARPAEPTLSSSSSTGGTAFDVALGGVGFILAVSQQTPILRETAQFKKDQFDASNEAGEQTLTNWWLRSQASFHGGAGLKYLELPLGRTTLDPITRNRFDSSYNVDVWTPGQVTRLPDTTLAISSGSASGGLVSARQSTNSYAIVALATALKGYKIQDDGTTSTITYTWGGSDTIQSLATDGKNYYAASATAIYSGPVDNSGSGTVLWNSGTLVRVAWCKQRLMAGIDNKIYELVGGAPPTLPAVTYTHPNTDWRWTAFAESPKGILAAGYSGDESAIVEFALDADGGAPTLAAGTVVATLPRGEICYALSSYAGRFLGLGTSAGLRVGIFADTGALSYGGLTFETDHPVRSVTGAGNFLYAAVTGGVEGESALVRVDLGTLTDDAGRYAYANDVVPPAAQTGTASGVTIVASRPVYQVDGYGLVLSGAAAGSTRTAWLRTSRIRYSTVEPKLFKFGTIRGTFGGTLNIYAQTPSIDERLILSLPGPIIDPGEFSAPEGAYEWLTLRFEMLSDASSELRSYGVKALPGTKRQRMIQLPLQCWDRGMDRNGRAVGGPGRALELINAVEALEENGDIVLYESLLPQSAESRRCQIDKVQFVQTVPPTRTSGYGGVLNVTLRTVD
jgi:hypothetical protein